jgi:hypothetical protein
MVIISSRSAAARLTDIIVGNYLCETRRRGSEKSRFVNVRDCVLKVTDIKDTVCHNPVGVDLAQR